MAPNNLQQFITIEHSLNCYFYILAMVGNGLKNAADWMPDYAYPSILDIASTNK